MKSAIYAIVFAAAMLFSSCAVKKPIYESKSSSDYNTRVKYSKPEYKYKVTAVGWTMALGAAGAGAYYGYKSNANLIQTNEISTSSVPDAIVGAAIGFGIVHIGNYLFAKKDKVVPINYKGLKYEDWLHKENKSEILLSYNSGILEAISSSAVNNYKIRDLADAQDYKRAFPASTYYNDILLRDHHNIKRSELPTLINLYPDYRGLSELKVRYISESNNLRELFSARNKYPDVSYDVERKAVILVRDFQDFKYFHRKYPTSEYLGRCIEKVYSKLTHDEIGELISLVPKYCDDDIKIDYILSSNSINELVKCSNEHPDLLSDQEIAEKAFSLVDSRSTAHTFYKYFKDSKFINDRGIVDGFKVILIARTNSEGKYIGRGHGIVPEDDQFYLDVEFRDGEINGYVEFYSDEFSYQGNYSDGEFNGHGVLKKYTPEGVELLRGNWIDGKFTGKGSKSLSGVKEEGNFVDGQLHGQGKRLVQNGENWIEGNFHHGKPHGYMEHRTPDGFRVKGTWVYGTPVGVHKVKKWTLGGFLTTYEGKVLYDENGVIMHQSEDYNFFSHIQGVIGDAIFN